MTRRLGKSGPHVGPIAFGGNIFGWTADEKISFHLLDAAVTAGFNLIDTADVYSRWAPGHAGGESETIIGNWLRTTGNRGRVVLATKVGMEMGPGEVGLSRSYILKAVEQSLNRLQTDSIDLYQSHKDDPKTPLEETLGAFGELIAQKKVRQIGASNYSAERLAEALRVSRAHKLPEYEILQPLYNLYDREPFEAELQPLCLKEGLAVIPYYSLAAGFLTGKYRSEADLTKSARGKTVKKYLNDRGKRILAALDGVAGRRGVNTAAVALAWLVARPGVTAPIASATSREHFDDLVAATRLQLDAGTISELDTASACASVAA
jgi:aryl-alcohol dehydrogenase-like predicted oxidoreductase